MPITIPHDSDKTTQINNNQRIASRCHIAADGLMTLNCHFWNNNRFDGDHYSAQIVALDANGQPIAACANVQGLDARFFGRVKEKTGEAHISIDPAKLDSIDRVEHYHSLPNSKDDEAIIADVAKKIGTAVETVRKIIKIFG